MTIRKNFNFNEETARHLEEKAKRDAKTQTQYLEELIEKDLKEEKRQKRLKALEALAGSVPAGILVDVDIRQIRIEKALKHAN
jgi:predicted DNA-binding protein